MFDHGIGGVEAIILLVIVLVVFGSKRLPDSARSLGRSLRIFKAETRGLTDADDSQITASPAGPVTPVLRFDPLTGEPLMRFDPVTGERLARWPSTTEEGPGAPPQPPLAGDRP